MFEVFNPALLKNLYLSPKHSAGEDNGQVTIIGGSSLFHGAPLLALKVASRIVDMVFFASPEPSLKEVSNRLKAKLSSFIWVPWFEVEEYIEKSDAILIGPGFMRYRLEKQKMNLKKKNWCDEECQRTRTITEKLLKKFPEKKWVVDAGSLQTVNIGIIPRGSILTPNEKEFSLLFEIQDLKDKSAMERAETVFKKSKEYGLNIVLKGPQTIVSSPQKCVIVQGGNAGMTKGGTGDTHAGLTVALLAKNEPFLAASSAAYIIKRAADELYKKVGINYNSDDLADKIPSVLASEIK